MKGGALPGFRGRADRLPSVKGNYGGSIRQRRLTLNPGNVQPDDPGLTGSTYAGHASRRLEVENGCAHSR
jgi:hypothetical protein